MGSSIFVKDNVAYIDGVDELRGKKLVGSDLRSSAALIIAALASKTTSHIYGLEHLDRGYENFELKLSKLGVKVVREITTSDKSDSNYQSSISKEKISAEANAA